jgi:hypothetical protein
MTLEDVGPDNWRHSAASRQDRLSQEVRLYDSGPPPPPKPQSCPEPRSEIKVAQSATSQGSATLAAQNRCSGTRVTTCRYIDAARRCDEMISERQGEGLKESVSLDVN